MDQEENKLNKVQFERRCPSVGEFLAYTSVVVVFLALLIPVELKYGYSSNLFGVFHLSNEKSDQFPFNLIKQLGLFQSKKVHSEKIFSKEELIEYSGVEKNKPIYLAFLGKVYDVTSGEQHYAKDGAYHFFAGKDASRAYVSGKFDSAGLIDDISGLPPSQYNGLKNWISTFESKYPCVGKVDGFFYDGNGNEREGVQIYKDGLVAGAKYELEEKADSIKFPGCNSMFKAGSGHQVWCSSNSGAVKREWIGVPRKYFKPGDRNFRCACVKDEFISDPRFKEFEDCPPDASRCKIVVD